jgi:FixJ family two-component response regulator
MTAQTHENPVVYLIDDDESLRTALTRLLRAAGHEVRAHASAAEFLMARQGTLRGCLILDVRMPGGPSGLELQKALIRQGERLPVIFLTGHGDIAMGVQAMKNGAFDFLTKPVERDPLLNAVRAALAHEDAVADAMTRQREVAARADQLTRAENEVFRRVVQGLPNKGIAAELGCSERTVKAHRSQVMAKMGASSLADLVQLSGLLKKSAAG